MRAYEMQKNPLSGWARGRFVRTARRKAQFGAYMVMPGVPARSLKIEAFRRNYLRAR